jgi:hypothetical protein
LHVALLRLHQRIGVLDTLCAALQRRHVHTASLSRLAPSVERRTSRSAIRLPVIAALVLPACC